MKLGLALFSLVSTCWNSEGRSQATSIGLFEKHADIGLCSKPGSATFDQALSQYAVTGGGANMWGNVDALHFVWTTIKGDVSLAADVAWKGAGIDKHRKACLILRESLEPDSPYADVAVHGDGLTSIQYREEKGGVTKEIQANIKSPHRVRVERAGNYVTMSWAMPGEKLHFSGGMFRIMLSEQCYVGLGVCAHNDTTTETALFSSVVLEQGRPTASNTASKPTAAKTAGTLTSTLERMPIRSTDRKVVHHIEGRFEAPNWSPDGKSFIYNQQGKLYSIPVTGGQPEAIPSGFADRINNDHGISPDGKTLAISDQTKTGKSIVYAMPIEGGEPKQITELAPSYWHGWSPDGKTLVYCAERAGNYDVYSISAEGGNEKRLTTEVGLDDGPEYSPDGKTIYFNSVRSGSMKIWRMNADGTEPKQLTSDEFQDWFAHPSPDGRWLVFVSYDKGIPADQHPANKDVMIRIMSTEGGAPRTLAKLFGGQGTMNVPSWSPDSSEISFVSYRLLESN